MPQASVERSVPLVAVERHGGGQDAGSPSVARPSLGGRCPKAVQAGARVAAGGVAGAAGCGGWMGSAFHGYPAFRRRWVPAAWN